MGWLEILLVWFADLRRFACVLNRFVNNMVNRVVYKCRLRRWLDFVVNFFARPRR